MLRAIGLGLLLLLGASHPAYSDDDEQRLKEVQAEIKKLQSWLNDARGEYDDLNKKLQKSDKDIAALVKQIDDTRARLREEQTRLKKLRAEQAQLRQLRTRHQQLLTNQVRISRQMGDEAALQFWLAQDDPNQNQRLVRYFGYFNRARVEHLHETITELVRLDNIEMLIAGQEKQLRDTDERLSNENKRLASTRQKQKTLLTKLSTQMSSEGERLKKRKADRKRLEELLNEVETLISNSPRRDDETPFKNMRGKLSVPLKGPIIAAFGSRNDSNKSRWEGWKIGTKEGTAVKSIHHGRVVFADWLRGFGLLIIIDHGQGYLSLYAHNQTLQHEVGSWVNGGDMIATAGQSGGQTKPALYFEIRHNGKPQDPAVWLKRK